jgi:hypothetical protein
MFVHNDLHVPESSKSVGFRRSLTAFFLDRVASIQFSERPLGKIRDFLPQNVKSKLNDDLMRQYSWKRKDALYTGIYLRDNLVSIQNNICTY